MTKNEIWDEVNKRYKSDKKTHPTWPYHICGQAAKVCAASNTLLVFAVDTKYNTKNELDLAVIDKVMKNAAIDTIVQSIRLLENLNINNG
jgi:hypothetical protein